MQRDRMGLSKKIFSVFLVFFLFFLFFFIQPQERFCGNESINTVVLVFQKESKYNIPGICFK